jgi:uncharacterized peroxidase-related enzyme
VELAEHVKHDYRRAKLTPRQKGLCQFAEMVTRAPSAISPRHLDTLRQHGLSDRDILDAVEVVSYFNFINRIAAALGTDPEPEMEPAHKQWQAESDPK